MLTNLKRNRVLDVTDDTAYASQICTSCRLGLDTIHLGINALLAQFSVRGFIKVSNSRGGLLSRIRSIIRVLFVILMVKRYVGFANLLLVGVDVAGCDSCCGVGRRRIWRIV